MTDLDHELQTSLRSHAGAVTAPIDFARRVDDRSRALRRRRYAVAVAGTAPVTAGVVVGAVALSGGHATRPAVLHDRPAASSTPSAAPTPSEAPIDLRGALVTCSSGQIPHVALVSPVDDRADPRGEFEPPADPSDILVARLFHSDQIDVTGAAGESNGYWALLDVNRSGPTVSKSWLIGADPATGGDDLYRATFEGCVAPTN